MQAELAEKRNCAKLKLPIARRRRPSMRCGPGSPLPSVRAPSRRRLPSSPTRDTTSGGVVKLRAEMTVLEEKIADHHAALRQIARALQPSDMQEAA